jgi:hypothetical protein
MRRTAPPRRNMAQRAGWGMPVFGVARLSWGVVWTGSAVAPFKSKQASEAAKRAREKARRQEFF